MFITHKAVCPQHVADTGDLTSFTQTQTDTVYTRKERKAGW